MRTLRSLPILILVLALSADALDHSERGTFPAPAQLAELTASDGAAQDYFGWSVAVSGNTVVVGAPDAEIGSNLEEGAAYVFVKPSGGWKNMTQVAKLTPSNGSAESFFGMSVAISGNTIVVGAPSTNLGTGAYVFVMPVGGWKDMTETAELTYDNAEFLSVAINGNVIVVGAPAVAVGSTLQEGAAFVYVKPKNGWVSSSNYTAELTASDGTYGMSLGWSVAISGPTVVSGAIYAPIGSTADQGAAYVFVQPAGGWKTATETAKLTASDGHYQDYLGEAVGISGSTIVAGAPEHSVPPSYLGAEYVFVKPSNGWTSATETAELTGASCSLGHSAAISGPEVLAGIPLECEHGAAYLYRMPKTGWITTSKFNAKLTAVDGLTQDGFGASVSISGATIVVGAPTSKTPGAAYVF